MLGGGGAPVSENGVGVPPQAGGLQFSTRWLGRPMRGFDQQPGSGLPQDGTLPDGTTPGGTSPRPRKPAPGSTSKPRGLP